MRITFVYPDFESIGIEYLMALAQKDGHQTELIFYQVENTYISRKKDNYSCQEVAARTIKTKPDLVCFSCVTDNYQYQLAVAGAIKKTKPQLKNIFGGIHPTAVAKRVIKESAVDAVAIGEAEISFIRFLRNCRLTGKKLLFPRKEVTGIVFKSGRATVGKFKEGELINLEDLPHPYKDPFITALKELQHRYSLITSRGCPYTCTYCFHSTICNVRGTKLVRQRSVRHVIDELLWAKSKYRFKVVYFMDDNFTTDKAWLVKFLNRYKKEIALPFGCASHPESMNGQIAKLLGGAGCIQISVGVQSLDPKLCREVIRRISHRRIISRAITDLKKAGVFIQIDHMFGIPGDSLEAEEAAILFYNRYRPDMISVFWLTYYPNTPIVETARQLGILNQSDIEKIENGEKITNGSLHNGGSMRNPGPYYPAQLMLNYLPFLPKWLVVWLIKTRFYQFFKIKNYYLSTLLPRGIQSLFDRRYFWGRNVMVSLFNNLTE